MNQDCDRRSGLFDSRFVAALVAAMACFGLFQATSAPTNADVAWYLYAGARMLDGARLGQDIVEVNTPPVLLLCMGVEALARALDISAIVLLPWLVTALACVSTALCAHFARLWPPTYSQTFLIALAYVLFVHIGGMFAQREHLLLIFAMPYACCVVEVARGRPITTPPAIAVGVVAMIGFTLKPFFIPAWIALETYLVWRRGIHALWRPQSLAMLATLLFIAAGVAVWTPEYLAFAAESVWLYRAYQPYGELPLFLSQSLLFVLVAICLALLSARSRAREVFDVCCISAISLSAAVFLQGKGWHYQWYPAAAFGMILLALAATTLARRSRFVTSAGIHTIVALTVILLAARTYFFWTVEPPERRELDALVRRHARGDSILALSSHLHAGFPLVNETGVRWASRYPTMWQICGLPRRPTIQSVGSFETAQREFLDNVAADITSDRPALLLVDSVPPLPAWTDFDYLGYFRQDPRLDELFKDYRLLQQVGRYRVYVRE